MKVLALRADDGGCAKYRIKEPTRVVSEQFPEIDIQVSTSANVVADRDPWTRITTVKEVQEDVDLIIVQRPLNEAFSSMLAQARRQGIATIVELDDDLSSVHQANIAYSAIQPERNPTDNRQWLEKTAAEADLLTCTTEALGKYNETHEILSNYVAKSIFDVSKRPRPVGTVGWTGTLQTHPHDLDVTRGQVAKVLADTGTNFYVVGDGKGVRDALKLKNSTRMEVAGWVPLEDYYATMAENIDIGIVPLERSDFNNAKSWLKGLEFAALGIPFVASATEDYRKLVSAGVGKLAEDHSGFRYALRRWLNDPASALADGQTYRDIVKDQFTYETHAEDWVRAWERAVDIRKKARK